MKKIGLFVVIFTLMLLSTSYSRITIQKIRVKLKIDGSAKDWKKLNYGRIKDKRKDARCRNDITEVRYLTELSRNHRVRNFYFLIKFRCRPDEKSTKSYVMWIDRNNDGVYDHSIAIDQNGTRLYHWDWRQKNWKLSSKKESGIQNVLGRHLELKIPSASIMAQHWKGGVGKRFHVFIGVWDNESYKWIEWVKRFKVKL